MTTRESVNYLLDKGFSQTSIARFLNVTRQRVSQIALNYIKLLTENDREEILYRDHYTCQWKEVCKGKFKKKDLQIHHIDRDSKNNNPDNLLTLCNKCHKHWHAILDEDKLKKYTCSRCGKEINYKERIPQTNICKECSKNNKLLKKLEQQNKHCKICGKKITNRGFYCYGCYNKKRLKNPIEKEKHKIQMHNQWLKIKGNPDKLKEWKIKTKKYQKKYNSKPEVKEKAKLYQQQRLQKIKQDPEKYKIFLEKEKTRKKIYWENKQIAVDKNTGAKVSQI